jgi:hypothetical protein
MLVTVVAIGLTMLDDEYPVAEHVLGHVVVVSVVVRVTATSRSFRGAARTVLAQANKKTGMNRMLGRKAGLLTSDPVRTDIENTTV